MKFNRTNNLLDAHFCADSCLLSTKRKKERWHICAAYCFTDWIECGSHRSINFRKLERLKVIELQHERADIANAICSICVSVLCEGFFFLEFINQCAPFDAAAA